MDKDIALSCFGWATLAAPYLLLIAANDFSSREATLLRAVFAVAAGWLLALAYVVVSQELLGASATPERLLAFYDRDGGPRAFVSVLGWVPAVITVVLAWPLHGWFARRRRRGA